MSLRRLSCHPNAPPALKLHIKCLDERLVGCVAEAEAKSNEPLSKFTGFFGPASQFGYLDNIDPTFVGNDPRARKALDAENTR